MEIRPLAPSPASQQTFPVEKPAEASPRPAQANAAPTVAPPAAFTATQLKRAVDRINTTIQTMSRDVEFSIDKDTDRVIVKIVDTKTKEVIRQIPPEETLEIAKALDKFHGLLIRQQA